MNKIKRTPVRHGDIPIPSESFFKRGVFEEAKKKGEIIQHGGSYILAEGSTTGHSHVLTAKMEIYKYKGGTYLFLREDGKLTHEEHKTIVLPKGNYFVGKERMMDHFAKAVKKVVD